MRQEPSRVALPAAGLGGESVAERRQLTVLFCDLVDFTPLAEQLDPEDLREVLREFKEVCGRIISRFEGYLARHLGDGLLVYFGYPQAHEDDARRAVQAALGIGEAVQPLNERLDKRLGVRLQTRAGIHTGLVVAGDLGEAEHFEEKAIVGQAPNVAARLQNIAPPDGVVISGATQKLVEGYFHYEELGPQTLKGVSLPIPAYRVLHESTARSRLDAQARLAPLVGRAEELEFLSDCWTRAVSGRGQAVAVIGEAGIGKSRIAQALKEHVAQNPDAWLTECACSPLHQNSALYPIIDLLERVVLQFKRGETAVGKRARLEAFLVQYGVPLPEGAPLLAALLSLPPLQSDLPHLVNPQLQKQKTLEMLVGMLITRARRQPMLLVLEDLHWIDPSTQELLALLLERIETVPLLVLLTARAPLPFVAQARADAGVLPLGRLAEPETERLVEGLTGGKRLPADVLRQILQKTDGVPFYVEEFTKMLVESGQLRDAHDHYELIAPLPAQGVPTTLQDSLMARLDRLSSVKIVAQAAATLGREFRYDLLLAVSPVDEAILRQGLRRLVEADLLHQKGDFPNAVFQFKHALLQESAYQSLLKATRQHYHEKIADTLALRFPEEAQSRPELLAHHYTEAGRIAEALPWWQRAGERALHRSANQEAVAHLRRTLDLLETLPPGPERNGKELTLLMVMGPALIGAHGYADAEVGRAYGRARELCGGLDDSPERFPILHGLFMFYLVRGELKRSGALAEQLLRLAEKTEDPSLLLGAHIDVCANFLFGGEMEPALHHGLLALSFFRPEEHRALTYQYGREPGSVSLAYIAASLWELGFPDQALAKIREARALADAVAFPATQASVRIFSAFIHVFREEWSEAAALCDEAISFASEQVIPFWLADGLILRGYITVRLRDPREGLALLQRGLAFWRQTGALLYVAHFHCFLAEALGEIGEIAQALALLDDLVRDTEERGEHGYDVTIFRVRAELALRQDGDRADAERWLRRAGETARAQKARSQGVRAADSLARLLHEQNRDDEAVSALTEALDGLTEGLDLPYVREARERLRALQGHSDQIAVG